MAEIYRNSTLTLSASAAKDSTVGLFCQDREDEFEPPRGDGCRSPIPYTTNSFKAATADEDFQLFSTPMNEERLPLLTRAWTFQERQLSPRLLHFGCDELIWECMVNRECECGGFKDAAASQGFHWPRKKENLTEFPAEEWERTVTGYSKLNLTYPMDVLPAIAGMAKAAVIARSSEYIAGLWKDDLLSGMCWMVPIPEYSRRPRGKNWRAPSFSRASVISTWGVKWLNYVEHDTGADWDEEEEADMRKRRPIC
jgi:hypothetical protein